ncbi:DUF7563 family protein [Halopenitus persicus]|uniref:DUF7563 family protein n=1 Tax=Halopenitus persicus TaxID=1048396 RepID=UPI0015A06DD3|nr:hypothetical protein [Halopenitus persicus]
MSECRNCGAFVTDRYASVFTPRDVDQPRVCPRCPDRTRTGGDVREIRGTRSG